MTILYAVIAHGPTVLCSHQVGTGNYDMVMLNVLPNIPTSQDAKTSYTSTNKYVCVLWMSRVQLCSVSLENLQLASQSFMVAKAVEFCVELIDSFLFE